MNAPETKTEPSPLKTTAKAAEKFRLSSVLGKSILATILLAGGIVGLGSMTAGGNLLGANHAADHVSESEKQTRAQAFAATASIQLSMVDDGDIGAAIDSMQLAPAAKQALMSDLLSKTGGNSSASAGSSASAAAAPAAQAVSPQQASMQPQSAPVSAKSEPTRLAWITVWDTDVEDGDVVRIESQGYSRTVTLTTKPITFAVPVPADGVIKVTGVLDGEGGGITVGLASGASKAVFPVMSVGQTLGLHVKMK